MDADADVDTGAGMDWRGGDVDLCIICSERGRFWWWLSSLWLLDVVVVVWRCESFGRWAMLASMAARVGS